MHARLVCRRNFSKTRVDKRPQVANLRRKRKRPLLECPPRPDSADSRQTEDSRLLSTGRSEHAGSRLPGRRLARPAAGVWVFGSKRPTPDSAAGERYVAIERSRYIGARAHPRWPQHRALLDPAFLLSQQQPNRRNCRSARSFSLWCRDNHPTGTALAVGQLCGFDNRGFYQVLLDVQDRRGTVRFEVRLRPERRQPRFVLTVNYLTSGELRCY